MDTFFTSRSAIEAYQKCPRYRWLHYLYGGKGITQKWANLPLTSGTCVHAGIEFILRNYQEGLIDPNDCDRWIDHGVQIALREYSKLVDESQIQVKQNEDAAQLYAIEQAKTESLVRAWGIAEFPILTKHFDVYSVEDELIVPISDNLILQARVDCILKDKNHSQAFFNYSLKTMRQYREGKTDTTFSIALQNITEVFAVEQHFKHISDTIRNFNQIAEKKVADTKKKTSLQQFVAKYLPLPPKRVMGTKFCFLVKGGKSESDTETSEFFGDSPLIRGYRQRTKDSGADISYCHSYYYPNLNNKSGKGSIGKNWEKFNVWEEMGVKEWMEMLRSQSQDHTGQMVFDIQPECGDIIKQQVITPGEVFAKREEIDTTLVQITFQEEVVRKGLTLMNGKMTAYGDENLDLWFPQHRHSCDYPTRCEFYPICHLKDWKGDSVDKKVREDPIGSGLYVWRVPHHKAEKEALGNENI